MTLGDKFGLLVRTVVGPVARTFFVGRDETWRDAAGVLRRVQYRRPRDVSAEAFSHVCVLATGKTRRRVLMGLLMPLGVFVVIGVIAMWAVGGTLAQSMAILIPFAAVWVIWVVAIVVYLRLPQIPVSIETSMVVTAWLVAGRCPSCGYLLEREAGGDGKGLRCAECGGLWRVGEGDGAIGAADRPSG